jgi:hypothetical protein
MTKSAARRAIAGGCNARAFSQTAPTNLKPLPQKLRQPRGARYVSTQAHMDNSQG